MSRLKEKLIKILIGFIGAVILVFGFNILGDKSDKGDIKESYSQKEYINKIEEKIKELNYEYIIEDKREDIEGVDSIALKNINEEAMDTYSQISYGIIGSKEENNLKKELVIAYRFNKDEIIAGNLINLNDLKFKELGNLLLGESNTDLSQYNGAVNEFIVSESNERYKEIVLQDDDKESIIVRKDGIVYRVRVNLLN